MADKATLEVADGAALRRLAKVRTVAGYDLHPSGTGSYSETYLDTRQRLLRAAGIVCRRRATGGGLRYTVTALGEAAGPVRPDERLDALIHADAPPSQWPAGRARAVVCAIVGEEQLEPLAELEQRATTRTARAGRRVVAEVSLESVRVAVRGSERTFQELVVECKRGGTEADVAAVVAALKDGWGLVDASGSRITRALALADSMVPPAPRAAAIPRKATRRRVTGAVTRGRGAGPAKPASAKLSAAQRSKRSRGAGASTPVAAAPAGALRPSAPRLQRPGLLPGTTMGEAARRTFAVHFGRMLDHEAGTRLGEDPEELHDMRVATRRMRAAQRLFASHLDRKVMKPFRQGFRRTGRALGAVRDLDVFHEKTLRYVEGLPGERRGELEPLLEHLGHAREAARAEMLAYLDGDEYRVFCERFAEFLSTPGAGAAPALGRDGEPLPHEVRLIVPAELHRHHGEVLAFDAPLSAPSPPLRCYHLLRITGKGLRYTLEFFAEVLGRDAKPLIAAMKTLQDHLGNLQDAVVASTMLSDFLRRGRWGKGKRSTAATPIRVAPGVAAYLTARQQELQRLVAGFPPVWERVRGREFGTRLGALAAALAVSGRGDPVSRDA